MNYTCRNNNNNNSNNLLTLIFSTQKISIYNFKIFKKNSKYNNSSKKRKNNLLKMK